MTIQTATATMIITIEVKSGGGAWGKDCTVAQIFKQGRESCIGHLEKVLREHGEGRIRIIGAPVVSAVIYPER